MMSRKLILTALLGSLLAAPLQAQVHVTIVQGLSGTPEFERSFDTQTERIAEAAASLTSTENIRIFRGDEARREPLLQHFSALAANMDDNSRAMIYLIGHGSYDGEEYKFNLPGPDINQHDIRDILDSLPGRNHFLLNTSSSSGMLLDLLADSGHTLITATRSGNERNAPEFGVFFAEALGNEEADLNKNNSISAQEAFNFAERRVVEFFSRAGNLATEHPQIRGAGAGNLILARISASDIEEFDDPRLQRLQQQLAELDQQIESLQLQRDEFSNEDYIQRLQALVLESARLNQDMDRLRDELNDGQR